MWEMAFAVFAWLVQGLARVLVAVVSIPLVFFMPRGPGYQHLTYFQTVGVRLKFIGKSIGRAFSDRP